MAAGALDRRAPISPEHDEVDAVAYAINALVGELHFTVTRLKRAEREAHQANEQKSLFLRNVSHELRTPLSAMLSYVTLLANTDLDAGQLEAVERIRVNGDALRNLIEDLLDMSRIEAGKLQLALTPVAPTQVAADVVQSLLPQARAKGVDVRLSLLSELPAQIVTDARRLRQILMNLVGNSVKFTDRGEVVLSMRVDRDRRTLVIEVTDSGVGMSEADQQCLFLPFATNDRGHGGSGLGLVLARQLSQQLGGSLELMWSQVGVGSRFRVTLGIASAEEELRPIPVLVRPPTNLGGLSVLLADDNLDLLACYSMLLELLGCEVAKATNGADAVEQVLARRFDVVLMDIQMPVLDGLEATRHLRRVGYAGTIFALSAHAMAEDRQRFLEAGCDDHIAKPVDMDDLAYRLATHRSYK